MGSRIDSQHSSWRTRLLVVVAALAIVLFMNGPGLESALAAGSRGILGGLFQNWNLNVPSSPMAGTALHCALEIPGPPPPSNSLPPFKVQIMINGWTVANPIPYYNYETNTWDFIYPVPPGSTGGTIKIWIHPRDTDIPSFSADRKIG